MDNKNLRHAACLHAQTNTEMKTFRDYGLTNPTAVITNGVNIAEQTDVSEERKNMLNRFSACRGKRLILCMSRIDPLKGLLDLAEAWGAVAHKYPEWHLLVAGPDNKGYFNKVKIALNNHNVFSRMTYMGPVYEQEKKIILNSAELFISPSHCESFGMAIGEALSIGLPVIATCGAPWEGLKAHKCGWWVTIGKRGLVCAMNEALSLPQDKLKEMGTQGKKWIEQDFTWDRAAQKMISTYFWVLNKGQKPSFIC